MEVNVKMNDGTERNFTINSNKKDSETVKFIELLFQMADGDTERDSALDHNDRLEEDRPYDHLYDMYLDEFDDYDPTQH